MDNYILNENSSVDVTVTYPSGYVAHESYDIVDLIESGYSFNKMLAEYKESNAIKVVIEVVF